MIFFGTVVNVTDDLKLGRVKVKVYDLHDNIDIKDLPWSMVVMPANTPGVRGLGHNVNLQIGTLVVGIFLDPHQQEFLVQGTLPTKTAGVADNNARVRGEANPHAGEPVATYQPPSTYAPVYPHNNVMETESGHVKEYDDTPSAERITERHKSGTQYEVGPNGSKTEVITRDNYRLVVGHDTLEVYGNVRVIISGHADVAVAGNLTASVAGDIAADSKGNITLKATETNKKIILNGEVSVTENLVVEKLTTTSNSTTPIALDNHYHTHGDPAGNTGEPTN
jgi:hypothetical protein